MASYVEEIHLADQTITGTDAVLTGEEPVARFQEAILVARISDVTDVTSVEIQPYTVDAQDNEYPLGEPWAISANITGNHAHQMTNFGGGIKASITLAGTSPSAHVVLRLLAKQS